MTDARTRERARASDAWFGAPREGQVPVRAAAGGPEMGGSEAAGHAAEPSVGARWLRRLGRVLRDAVLAVAILAMVPIGVVTVVNARYWTFSAANTRGKLLQGERARPFAPSKDATVTPMQAGLALAALSPDPQVSDGFPLRPVSEVAVRPWRDVPLSAEMFPSARPGSWSGPNSQSILEAAAHGLSARELAYLKTVATAPLWAKYDMIARSPAVDILGGRFRQPYPADALLYQMPTLRYGPIRELAYAGVSRAAYYLAIGRRAEAEAALKSIIGFGFALTDNGTFALDGLIGRTIVGIGRDGLERFYTLTGDPRAADVRAAKPVDGAGGPAPRASEAPSAEYLRERFMNTATNPAEPRTIRYSALQQLSLSSCTNARELLFGTGADVRRTFDVAARDLARYPSETAMLDLMLHVTDRSLGTAAPSGGVFVRLIVGASTIAGTVLDNPRMPFCTRVITGNMP